MSDPVEHAPDWRHIRSHLTQALAQANALYHVSSGGSRLLNTLITELGAALKLLPSDEEPAPNGE